MAPADPGPVPRHRPGRLGSGAPGSDEAARLALRRPARRAGRRRGLREPTDGRHRGPEALPHPGPVVPGVGRRAGLQDREGGNVAPAQGDRLLQPRVRHHPCPAAVLGRSRHSRGRPPQGGLRHGGPRRRGGPVLQDRLLPPVAQPGGLAAGGVPGPRPGRPAPGAAARAGRAAQHRRAAPGARADAQGARMAGAGRPRAAAAARLRRPRQRRHGARGHRGALRRRGRPASGTGAAPRHRRRQSAAVVVPPVRCAGAGRLPQQRGARRLQRYRADLRARHPAQAHLRRGARGGPGLHDLHDAHSGAGRDRPVPRGPDRRLLRRRQRDARHTRRAAARPGRRELQPGAARECSTWR